jgi:hypothetical protein
MELSGQHRAVAALPLGHNIRTHLILGSLGPAGDPDELEKIKTF